MNKKKKLYTILYIKKKYGTCIKSFFFFNKLKNFRDSQALTPF